MGFNKLSVDRGIRTHFLFDFIVKCLSQLGLAQLARLESFAEKKPRSKIWCQQFLTGSQYVRESKCKPSMRRVTCLDFRIGKPTLLLKHFSTEPKEENKKLTNNGQCMCGQCQRQGEYFVRSFTLNLRKYLRNMYMDEQLRLHGYMARLYSSWTHYCMANLVR